MIGEQYVVVLWVVWGDDWERWALGPFPTLKLAREAGPAAIARVRADNPSAVRVEASIHGAWLNGASVFDDDWQVDDSDWIEPVEPGHDSATVGQV